jgi:3-dehydroquinate dehydratase-2
MTVLVINGPNMVRLSQRGSPYNASYQDIVDSVVAYSNTLKIQVDFFVNDSEGQIVQAIGESMHDAIIINAAAYSHYSIAIRDALQAFKGIKIEVHMSNIFAREDFRQNSMLAPEVNGVICGFGIDSYNLALQACFQIYYDETK